MEDLDAELLAVTDGKKRSERKSSPSDSDGAEFEGIADSDGAEDDDAELDHDDDDDDDNEYGVDDEDDDDYISKSKSKRKSSRSSERKKSSKSRQTKRRTKSSDKKTASRSKGPARSEEPADIDDDAEFQYKYDEQGYGDAADRERLLKMNEVERELELEARIEDRNREYDIWKKKREIMAREANSMADMGKRTSRSSGRTKQSSKSDALQALAEDKRKKSSRVVDMDLSDADSEPDQMRRGEMQRETKKEVEELKPDKELMQEHGPSLIYSDLVDVNAPGGRVTTPLFMRRDSLIRLSQEPFFERVVLGLFARVKAPGQEDEYLLCRIASVKKGSVYKMNEDRKTNWLLVLEHGRDKRSFQIFLTSGSHPTESEFQRYRYVCNRDIIELARRDEIERLTKNSLLAFQRRITPTEEEEKNHIANMEVVYPHRVNWTLKRTEAKTALDIKQQDLENARAANDEESIAKLEAEVNDIEKRLIQVRQYEEQYVLKNTIRDTDVFKSLAKRNMQLNSANDTLASRQARQSGPLKANPFARVDTTGQSYFSIKSEKKLAGAGSPTQRIEDLLENDWRRFLSIWKPNLKRRRISENPVDPLYDAEIPCVDILDRVNDHVLESQEKKQQAVPPGVDAVYESLVNVKRTPPEDARIISFEDWVRG
ncbi:RNA polymerase-associated protein Rtf1 [Gracilaria domingensis]|nr:RNA polymerase-associated protein Rtf1 [Gracilaria domingensis]